MEIWPTLPGYLSTGKHISRTEVKEHENMWLELRLVLTVLPKVYLTIGVLIAKNICHSFSMSNFINQKSMDIAKSPESIWMSFPVSIQETGNVTDPLIQPC